MSAPGQVAAAVLAVAAFAAGAAARFADTPFGRRAEFRIGDGGAAVGRSWTPVDPDKVLGPDAPKPPAGRRVRVGPDRISVTVGRRGRDTVMVIENGYGHGWSYRVRRYLRRGGRLSVIGESGCTVAAEGATYLAWAGRIDGVLVGGFTRTEPGEGVCDD